MAGKKKQIEIPQTCTSRFMGMNKKELREWSKSYYSNAFIGKKVKTWIWGLKYHLKGWEAKSRLMEQRCIQKKQQQS